MNRQEEINEMAKEVATYLTSDKDIQVAFADVLKKGAEWADDHPDIDVRTMAAWQSGYKEAIERACDWLEENIDSYLSSVIASLGYSDYVLDWNFINDFKKAMKGD